MKKEWPLALLARVLLPHSPLCPMVTTWLRFGKDMSSDSLPIPPPAVICHQCPCENKRLNVGIE